MYEIDSFISVNSVLIYIYIYILNRVRLNIQYFNSLYELTLFLLYIDL